MAFVVGFILPSLLIFKLSWLIVEHEMEDKSAANNNNEVWFEPLGDVKSEFSRLRGKVTTAITHPLRSFVTKVENNRKKHSAFQYYEGKQWRDMTLYGVLIINLKNKNRTWYPGFLLLRRFVFITVLYIGGPTIDVNDKGTVVNLQDLNQAGQGIDIWMQPAVIIFILTIMTVFIQVVTRPYVRDLDNGFAIYCTLTLVTVSGIQLINKRILFNIDTSSILANLAESTRTQRWLNDIMYVALWILVIAMAFMYIDFWLHSFSAYRRLLDSIKNARTTRDKLHTFASGKATESAVRIAEHTGSGTRGQQLDENAQMTASLNTAVPDYSIESDKKIQLALELMESDAKEDRASLIQNDGPSNSSNTFKGISLLAKETMAYASTSSHDTNENALKMEEEKVARSKNDKTAILM